MPAVPAEPTTALIDRLAASGPDPLGEPTVEAVRADPAARWFEAPGAYADVVGIDARLVVDLAHPRVADHATSVIEQALAAGAEGVWVRAATPGHDTLLASLGLHPVRTLLQLRIPLPVDPAAGTPVDTRAFRPGEDDAALLDVNNRAFSWHPEQSGWTQVDLDARMTGPWFRADGFRVRDEPAADGSGTRLAGFCWTKVHPPRGPDPALGEIYVIAVDPDVHGRGLGKGLTLAGLDWLHRHGLTVGMLYTEADNGPALRLYERLGFVLHHADVRYALV